MKWTKFTDEKPPYAVRIVVEWGLPLEDSFLRKICYDLGLYIEEGTPLTDVVVVDEENDLTQLGSYIEGDGGEVLLEEGFYRHYDNWDGEHLHSLGGDLLMRWTLLNEKGDWKSTTQP